MKFQGEGLDGNSVEVAVVKIDAADVSHVDIHVDRRIAVDIYFELSAIGPVNKAGLSSSGVGEVSRTITEVGEGAYNNTGEIDSIDAALIIPGIEVRDCIPCPNSGIAF